MGTVVIRRDDVIDAEAELWRSCWHAGLMQGCGSGLDQMTSTSSVCWHKTSRDYDNDDVQVRLLTKVVQLCYVSIR